MACVRYNTSCLALWRRGKGNYTRGLNRRIEKDMAVRVLTINILWKGVQLFNPFPHDKILDLTKLKAFADEKLNVSKMIISVFDRVENIVGKGEIACTSNFSFSHNVFKRLLSQRRQKVPLCGNGLKGK